MVSLNAVSCKIWAIEELLTNQKLKIIEKEKYFLQVAKILKTKILVTALSMLVLKKR